jgi:hypothetical protein
LVGKGEVRQASFAKFRNCQGEERSGAAIRLESDGSPRPLRGLAMTEKSARSGDRETVGNGSINER